MKIPLYFAERYGGKKPAISFTILAPRVCGQVEAIIDTGSPISLISLKDVIKLNIPVSNFPFWQEIVGYSKTKEESLMKVNKIKNATIFLKDCQDKSIKIITDFGVEDTSFSKKLKQKEKELEYSEVRPSLIGQDLLESQGFTLVVNPSKNIAYLEKEDEISN